MLFVVLMCTNTAHMCEESNTIAGSLLCHCFVEQYIFNITNVTTHRIAYSGKSLQRDRNLFGELHHVI